MNAGAAFTTEVVFQSVTVPANTLSPGSCLNARVYTASSTAAGVKTTRLKIGGGNAIPLQNSSTTAVVLARDLSIMVATPTKAYSNSNQVSTGSTAATTPIIDISTAMDVAISGQLDTAGMFLFMLCPKLEIF